MDEVLRKKIVHEKLTGKKMKGCLSGVYIPRKMGYAGMANNRAETALKNRKGKTPPIDQHHIK